MQSRVTSVAADLPALGPARRAVRQAILANSGAGYHLALDDVGEGIRRLPVQRSSEARRDVPATGARARDADSKTE